jgi:hypothetical protein
MTTPLLPHRRARRVAQALAGSVLATSLVLTAGIGTPAVAAEEPELRDVRICDPTGCYLAWGVVDSDGDGVSDADEVMAGTDPQDATSTPPMAHLVDLLPTRQLPSFEAGLAVFVVLPPQVTTMGDVDRAEALLQAFPLAKRTSLLEHIGLSTESLAERGIDPTSNGLTIGLDHPTKDGAPAPIRVGGMDVRLISCGWDWDARHGGVVDSQREGNKVTEIYRDGARTETTYDENGDWKKIKHYDENGNLNQEATVIEPEHDNAGGSHEGPEHGTEKNDHGDDGGGDDGGGGGRPVSNSGNPEDPHDEDYPFIAYLDPDATTVEITPEQVDLALRKLGSVVLTVQDWSGPETDPSTLKRPATTILVDPEAAGTYDIVFDAPRVTTAQPEFGNGLPSPLDAVTGPPAKPPCDGLC